MNEENEWDYKISAEVKEGPYQKLSPNQQTKQYRKIQINKLNTNQKK